MVRSCQSTALRLCLFTYIYNVCISSCRNRVVWLDAPYSGQVHTCVRFPPEPSSKKKREASFAREPSQVSGMQPCYPRLHPCFPRLHLYMQRPRARVTLHLQATFSFAPASSRFDPRAHASLYPSHLGIASRHKVVRWTVVWQVAQGAR